MANTFITASSRGVVENTVPNLYLKSSKTEKPEKDSFSEDFLHQDDWTKARVSLSEVEPRQNTRQETSIRCRVQNCQYCLANHTS